MDADLVLAGNAAKCHHHTTTTMIKSSTIQVVLYYDSVSSRLVSRPIIPLGAVILDSVLSTHSTYP